MNAEGTFILTQRAFRTRHYSSLTGLLVLVLDHALTFRDEYNHIWRAKNGIKVRFMYLTARYFTLSAEIAHYILLHVFLSHAPVPHKVCEAWFFVLTVICSALVLILDAVLFLRIFALYQKNPKVFLIWIPILMQTGLAVSLVVRNNFNSDSFNHQCDMKRIPAETPFIGVGTVLTHGTLWVATFAKRNVAQGRAVIVRLVVHEGAWIFILLCAIVAGVLPYSFASRSSNPSIIFIWPMSMISIATCRLIMSLRLLDVESPTDRNANAISPIDDDDFQLTTFISAFHSLSHEQVERLQFPGPPSKSDHRFKSHPGAHQSPSPC